MKFLVADSEATRLFEDLLSGYNKLIRPLTLRNKTAPLEVKFKMRLSQLLDVVCFLFLTHNFISLA